MRLLFLLTFATGFVFGFSKAVEKPVPPAKLLEPRWNGKHPDAAKWTEHTLKEVKAIGLDKFTPKDMNEFCPDYSRDPANTWVYIVSAMTELESNFNPASTYKENFKDSTGNYVISTGLLQLSTESGKGYKCDVSNLKDPYLNLTCGVKILHKWVAQDKQIYSKSAPWRGSSRYWSTMRPSKVDKIKAWTKTACF